MVDADVNVSWQKLYERQAPLLDWPPEVEKPFKAWGDAWPKDVDPSQIQLVINEYVQVYPEYVKTVYSTFDPWDPETGKGLVVAPPEEMLLRPATAIMTPDTPPTLGQVQVAQKRLWIQRTLLDIIHNVNATAGAKDWDSAWIKKITALEVASPLAQDQVSVAKGQLLEIPPEPTAPGAAPATPTTPGEGPAPTPARRPATARTAAVRRRSRRSSSSTRRPRTSMTWCRSRSAS